MEYTLIILKQTCIMFILMMIGVMLYKKNFITKQGSKELGSMLLYVVIPIVIIKSFAIEFTVEKAKILGITFLLALLVLALSIGISHIFFKENGVDDFAAAFSNAGFIGIPLVQAVLGHEAVFYITSLIAILNILQWTYGVYLISKNKSVIHLGKLIKNPIVISFIIGVALFLMPIPLPTILTSTMEAIGNLNTPLAMIVLGIYLAQSNIKELFTSVSLYKTCLIRLLLIPIITVIVMSLLPVPKDICVALLIAAAAPSGANVAIYAQQYNADYTRAVMLVCLSTLLSIVTLPIIISVAAYII